MTLVSWMYISRSLLPPDRAEEQLERLVASSHVRNQEHGLTGALMFTGTRFAQYVEGPFEHVMALRRRISVDPRHTDLVAIEETVRRDRRFENWSLAFAGSSWRYVAKVVERPLETASDSRRQGVEALQRLMLELANQSRG